MDRIRLTGKGMALFSKAVTLFNKLMDEASDPEAMANDLIERLLRSRRVPHYQTLLAAAQHVIGQWNFTDSPSDYDGWMTFLADQAVRQTKPCAYLEELLFEALDSRLTEMLSAVIDTILTLDLRRLKCRIEPHRVPKSPRAWRQIAATWPRPATQSESSYSASPCGTPTATAGGLTLISSRSPNSLTHSQSATASRSRASESTRSYEKHLDRLKSLKGRKTLIRRDIADSLVFALEEKGEHQNTFIAAALDALRS